jgi:hypothetical protein
MLCPRPPWRGCSMTRHGKKQEGPEAVAVLFAPSIVDAQTLTSPKNEVVAMCLLTATTSTSANSAFRGYHLYRVHTCLYSSRNTRILTTLRLRGGISTHRLLPSASAPSFVCVLICICVGGMTPLLGCQPIWMGLYIYIYILYIYIYIYIYIYHPFLQ